MEQFEGKYEHQRTVILPKARYDWMHLRLQDLKSVSGYNSAIFRISSQLQLCGEKITDEDMLEKTFSIFHASNVLLQQQYREKGFRKYSELISCLLVAEQNNELLMKNHEACPTGSAPFPEVNAATYHPYNGQNRGRGHGRGHSRGRGRGRGCSRNSYNYDRQPKNVSEYQKGENIEKDNKSGENSKMVTNLCYRCCMKGHWSRTCRTPKHLVDLYQESLKKKDKKAVETNFVSKDESVDHDLNDMTHLDVANFFIQPEANIKHLFGDENLQK